MNSLRGNNSIIKEIKLKKYFLLKFTPPSLGKNPGYGFGCTGGFRRALNWTPMMSGETGLWDSYIFDRC